MNALKELIWLTQLGLSIATPFLLCVLAAVWLQDHFMLGRWVIVVALLCGLSGAFSSGLTFFRHTKLLNAAERKKHSAPVSFNEHD